MRLELSKYAPPGLDRKSENIFFSVGMALAFLYSTTFVVRYVKERKKLYWICEKGLELIADVKMPEFSILLGDALIGFLLVAIGMLAFGVYHYLYHCQDAKSIYLMRRLPNKWELHRRCLTIPVTAVMCCGLTALLLLGVYYGIYVYFTPKICLP